ncbi:hypothetical protein K439DRAFT_758757 [Ramaria rubella]|nr:hypothetical protein K439DRAFT_758757 [Ramaria rubella]
MGSGPSSGHPTLLIHWRVSCHASRTNPYPPSSGRCHTHLSTDPGIPSHQLTLAVEIPGRRDPGTCPRASILRLTIPRWLYELKLARFTLMSSFFLSFKFFFNVNFLSLMAVIKPLSMYKIHSVQLGSQALSAQVPRFQTRTEETRIHVLCINNAYGAYQIPHVSGVILIQEITRIN